jgi:DNA helicase-2/ATP-dependent DNA helicase PcrA
MTLHLSPIQKQIVEYDEGPLLVVAGPGSGKTRVLTERVRRLLTQKREHFRVLALTFTNKAANEMKERLQAIPDVEQRTFIGTLHSFCTNVLADRGKPVGIIRMPNIFESLQDRRRVLLGAIMGDPYLKQLLEQAGDKKKQTQLVDRWLQMVADAKNQLMMPEVVEDPIERRVYEAYNLALRASDAVDFDDLLLLTYRLFQERPKIADFYRRQYRYICVDEAQDLNEAQYQMLCSLCGSEHKNVMMVGDPKQAIFVWNRASPKYMSQFEKDFGAVRFEMNENFRSSKAIVRVAKTLVPEYTVEGQLPIEGDVVLIVGDSEEDEAIQVLDYIKGLVDNSHPDVEGPLTLDSCALLGRTRYVLASVEEELAKRGWPYHKQVSSQHESESDLLRDFELCLRLLANPRDRLHLEMLTNRWNVQAEDALDYSGESDMRELVFAFLQENCGVENSTAVLEAVRRLKWTENTFQFTEALDWLNNYSMQLESQERALIMEDINVWRRHWDTFLRTQRGGNHSLSMFLGQVALGSTQQSRNEGLALLTVHSSKGMEFDVVAIMGMTEGTFPDYRARGAALSEEKRNAFVATTRSRRLLIFSYPKTKVMPWDEIWIQKPSRYLKDLDLAQTNG